MGPAKCRLWTSWQVGLTGFADRVGVVGAGDPEFSLDSQEMGLLFEERSRNPSGTFLGFGEGLGSRQRCQLEGEPSRSPRVPVSPSPVSQVRPQECGSVGRAPESWVLHLGRGEEGGQVGGWGLEEGGSGVVSPCGEAW